MIDRTSTETPDAPVVERAEPVRATASVPAPAPAPAPVVAPAPVTEPVRRPRGSGLATFSLLLGFAAAGAVASGVLAVPGIGVGLLGVLFAVIALMSTGRPYVTGRLDALLAMLFSLGAIVVGLLALGHTIPWPDPDTNQVARLADWLDREIPWLTRF